MYLASGQLRFATTDGGREGVFTRVYSQGSLLLGTMGYVGVLQN